MVALACLLAVACVVHTVRHLAFETDRADLLHPSDPIYQNWKRYAEEFGGESDLVVIATGPDMETIQPALESLASRIQSCPDQFEKLCYRLDLSKLRRKGLYQLPREELAAIREQLGSLAAMAGPEGTLPSLDVLISAALGAMASGPFERTAGRPETIARMVAGLEGFLESGEYRSPWSASPAGRGSHGLPEYFYFDDGKIAILRVVPVRDPRSFQGLHEPVRLLRSLVAQIEPNFPGVQFGLTGLPVLEDDEMQAARKAGTLSTLLTVLGVGALFVIGFRSLRHPLFAILALGIGAAWTLGWVTITVGHLNVLSVSFIVTLIGLGIDFGILWLSRYEASRSQGSSIESANLETVDSVGPGIVVGGLTTAAAFLATVLTGFRGVAEMGWIAGSGVLICLLATFTVLPALLAWGGGAPVSSERGQRDELPAFPWAARRPLAWAILVVLGIAGLATQSHKVAMDYNLLHLQARGIDSVHWERWLLERTGTSAWYALSISHSAEEARRIKREFEAQSSVGRIVELASLVPHDQHDKQPIIREIRDLLAKIRVPAAESRGASTREAESRRREVQDSIPEGPAGEPAQRLLALIGQMAQIEPREGSGGLAAIVGSVRRCQDLLDRATSAERDGPAGRPEQVRRLAQFESQWRADLANQLLRIQDAADPEPVTIEDLPMALRERYHSPSGKWLLQIFANTSVWDLGPLQQFADQVRSVDPEATGKPLSTLHALVRMTGGYWRSTWLVALVIVAMVWLDLRSITDTLLSFVPLALGLAGMFGAMGALGISLNPANLITLPLMLGLGIDSGVHLLHDYRQSRGRYHLSWRLGRALLLTSLTTCIAFCSLWTARHWGMVSIGLVLFIGISFSTLASLVVLPGLLTVRSESRSAEEETPFGLPEDDLPARAA